MPGRVQQRVEAAAISAAAPSRGGDARSDDSRRVRRGPKSKEQKRREAEARQNGTGGKTSARKKRRAVQDEITRSEKRLEELEMALLDSAVHADGKQMKKLVTEQRKLRSRVDELYEKWAKLED